MTGGTMATVTAPLARPNEDRFFIGLAALCAAIAIPGFAPTYWMQLPAGTFVGSPLVHLHGLLFTAWTLFFISQAVLIANRRYPSHRAWAWSASPSPAPCCSPASPSRSGGLQGAGSTRPRRGGSRLRDRTDIGHPAVRGLRHRGAGQPPPIGLAQEVHAGRHRVAAQRRHRPLLLPRRDRRVARACGRGPRPAPTAGIRADARAAGRWRHRPRHAVRLADAGPPAPRLPLGTRRRPSSSLRGPISHTEAWSDFADFIARFTG